ncbi:alginate lyase family protein [Kushneria sp. TE3]|uniref:alginate lyase family protein n=1 Tax=Kushneria sp. TE3 TaxID=3449832 RepID=UPI003F6876FC
MLSAEKAIYLDLCSGLSVGHQWLDKHASSAPQGPVPETVLLEGKHLVELANLYKDGDQNALQVVEGLVEKATDILEQPVTSVIQKSGDMAKEHRHDYCSLAKYWWPDMQSEDGLPYVRRDGEVNPECYSERFDNERLVFMVESLQVLSLTAYLTGDTVWAERALEQLKTWFIDPATCQTPHFQYAQVVPGNDAVRSAGLIESRHLIYVTEAVYLLESIQALPETVSHELRCWFKKLLEWMRTSQNGRAADHAKNNIAYWYDLQCLAFAWFVKDQSLAEHIVLNRVQTRAVDQIEPDGSLPLEMKRANPLDYVVFTLAAMSQLSRYGDRLGIPVWQQTDADGRSFQVAHDWLLQQTRVREGQKAAQYLYSGKNNNPSSQIDDLILQMAINHHLAESRKIMLEERNRWRDINVSRINELEKSLEESDKYIKKTERLLQKREQQLEQKGKGLEDSVSKQGNAHVGWLEKEVVRTRDDRIQELQNQIKEKNEQQKIDEKQQKMLDQLQKHKEKLVAVEARFKETKQQFDISIREKEKQVKESSDAVSRIDGENLNLKNINKQLEEKNKSLINANAQFKENEKKFNELLKSNEKELEILVKNYQKNSVQSDSKKLNDQLKKIQQEHKKEIRSCQRKNNDLQEKLDQQKKRADYFKDRSDKVLKSRSWRLTGLLRKIASPMSRGGSSTEKKK